MKNIKFQRNSLLVAITTIAIGALFYRVAIPASSEGTLSPEKSRLRSIPTV